MHVLSGNLDDLVRVVGLTRHDNGFRNGAIDAPETRVGLTDDVELTEGKLFSGDVVVCGSGVFRLHGTLDGALRVATGGIAVVHGRVLGDVTNSGGHLLVFGTIDGCLRDLGGRTYVDESAIVEQSAMRRHAAQAVTTP